MKFADKNITPTILMDKKLSPKNLMDEKLPPQISSYPPADLMALFYTTLDFEKCSPLLQNW